MSNFAVAEVLSERLPVVEREWARIVALLALAVKAWAVLL